MYRLLLYFLFLLTTGSALKAQDTIGFFEPSPTYRSDRMLKLTSAVGLSYAAATIGLSQIWYKDTEQGKFHLFNDWNEWNNMDKYGHFLTAYHYTRLGAQAFHWTGMEKNKAIWVGIGVGNLLQTTVEILDGFSNKWGFSIADMGFNVAGSLFAAGQEWVWNDQRIVMKLSTYPHTYSDQLITSESGNAKTSLRIRADDLLGATFSESWLKDYNQQIIWASFNIYSFLNRPKSKFPKWLNVAVGYGAENMFGGFDNRWEVDGEVFALDPIRFARYSQFYLSIDIDLSRIKTKSPFLRTLFTTINFIKIPAPGIEWNKQDHFKIGFW